jgi:hypothetical protein
MNDPVAIAATRENSDRQPKPADDAARAAQVLGELLSHCRSACDSDLPEEQPIGTFRVEET